MAYHFKYPFLHLLILSILLCALLKIKTQKNYKLKDAPSYPFLMHKPCAFASNFLVHVSAHMHTHTQKLDPILCYEFMREFYVGRTFFLSYSCVPALFIFPSYWKLYNFDTEVVSLNNLCIQGRTKGQASQASAGGTNV